MDDPISRGDGGDIREDVSEGSEERKPVYGSVKRRGRAEGDDDEARPYK